MTTARWAKPAGAVALLLYFCYFSWDVVRVLFAPDDLMNLDYYWRLDPLRLLLLFIEPWRGGYRPMGGLFYMPLLRAFGLNPAPYHVAMLALLLANVYLVYRFARVLGCCEAASFLAALVACYHGGLSFLYYNTSFIYDVLCWFFYLAAFVYYAGIRARGRRLGVRQTAVFLVLCLCALNSKEMAVTIPLVLIAYEWFYQEHRAWLTAIFAALLNLPVLYRVLLGPESLVRIPEYRPEFSLARVGAFQAGSFSDLFESWHFFTSPWVVAVWVVFTALAWRTRRPVLRFCWWFFVLTPLPIELLAGRTSACLAIPFSGMAVFVAVLFVDTADALARLAPGPRLQRAAFVSVLTLGAGLWAVQNARLKESLIRRQMDDLGQQTWTVIRQLQALHPQVRPHSTVIFLNDPFEDFDMAFIAELSFRQRDLNIRLQRKTPVPPAELAKADHLFSYEEGKLSQIR